MPIDLCSYAGAYRYMRVAIDICRWLSRCGYRRMGIDVSIASQSIRLDICGWLWRYGYGGMGMEVWRRMNCEAIDLCLSIASLASLACGTKAPAPPFLPLPPQPVLKRAAPFAKRKRAAATTSKKMAWWYLCARRGLSRAGLERMQQHLHTHTHTLDGVTISILDT